MPKSKDRESFGKRKRFLIQGKRKTPFTTCPPSRENSGFVGEGRLFRENQCLVRATKVANFA
jgi:hypothetical protein